VSFAPHRILKLSPPLRLLLQSGSQSTLCVDWPHTHILLDLWHSVSKRASSSLSLFLSPYDCNSADLHETIVNDLAFFLSRVHIVSNTLWRGRNKKVSTRDALRLYQNEVQEPYTGLEQTLHALRCILNKVVCLSVDLLQRVVHTDIHSPSEIPSMLE